ncbi:conserved hypothetical protein [Histoplasma capsulatum var. duboisii H88]|uniref:Uncharacterized protein n=2 Tax=Ajellomyces capsulatus TaxID=5037 RepID=F0U7Z8_AJEC8|nr:conserved hypothetical protein [Histoplasma capsulatum H143]EGC40820.1 conserved hypothetical protein [Histoplasma capsulatum var. duboisii H88]
MATEAVNGAPVPSETPKEDTNNTAGVDAGKSTAVDGDAPTEVSAPEAGAATPANAEKDADSSAKSAGDKHERANATEDANQTRKDEPATKKQKTDAAPPKAASGSHTSTAENGDQKRGPGRPKKSGTREKPERKTPKPRATEGVGSRTRSRVQA